MISWLFFLTNSKPFIYFALQIEWYHQKHVEASNITSLFGQHFLRSSCLKIEDNFHNHLPNSLRFHVSTINSIYLTYIIMENSTSFCR